MLLLLNKMKTKTNLFLSLSLFSIHWLQIEFRRWAIFCVTSAKCECAHWSWGDTQLHCQQSWHLQNWLDEIWPNRVGACHKSGNTKFTIYGCQRWAKHLEVENKIGQTIRPRLLHGILDARINLTKKILTKDSLTNKKGSGRSAL